MLKVLRTLLITLLVVLLCALSFGAGFGVSQRLPQSSAKAFLSIETPKELNILGEVWQILSQEFVDKKALNPRKLSEGAIQGMIEALGDPHTAYIDAEQYRLGLSSFTGSFEGIGAQVAVENKQLIVVAPIPGSPADRAGIKAKDKIIEVNGEPTSQMTLAEAVGRIRGARGTIVTLLVLHESEQTPVRIEVTRDVVNTDSVLLKILPGNIAHIWITHFSERTSSELAPLLKEALDKKVLGIVLDLRGNPGGILDITVEVASQFIKDGVVLYEVDSEGRQQVWKVRGGGLATDVPLAVLVNESSASGSEVVAGALQDYGRAPIIGTKTAGKGSVNHIRELSDGSALYVTFARWLTPKGRLIEGQGLTPDVELALSKEDIDKGLDLQLERAIEYIKGRG